MRLLRLPTIDHLSAYVLACIGSNPMRAIDLLGELRKRGYSKTRQAFYKRLRNLANDGFLKADKQPDADWYLVTAKGKKTLKQSIAFYSSLEPKGD